MLPYTLGSSCFSFLPPPPPLFVAEMCLLALSLSLCPSSSSFRPSLPKKRLGIYLIDRFTAPEDILSATVYETHIFFFPCSANLVAVILEIAGSKG